VEIPDETRDDRTAYDEDSVEAIRGKRNARAKKQELQPDNPLVVLKEPTLKNKKPTPQEYDEILK
jgi:hypothetical protein